MFPLTIFQHGTISPTKINYVQNIKRKKGDLPTGRAHTSRNKK
jgi:hypothetical protein